MGQAQNTTGVTDEEYEKYFAQRAKRAQMEKRYQDEVNEHKYLLDLCKKTVIEIDVTRATRKAVEWLAGFYAVPAVIMMMAGGWGWVALVVWTLTLGPFIVGLAPTAFRSIPQLQSEVENLKEKLHISPDGKI